VIALTGNGYASMPKASASSILDPFALVSEMSRRVFFLLNDA